MTSKALVPAGEPIADMKLVEEAVAFINEKLNASVYRTYEEIGNFLLEKFFDGNIERAASRNPRKPVSYRALCRHAGLAIDPARLSVMLRVAAQERFLIGRKVNTGGLSYTQKAELVKLPDGDEKIKVVKQLQKTAYSTRQTAELIAEKRRRKRRPGPPNRNNLNDPEMSEEEFQSETAKLGLKVLLLMPLAPVRILDEGIFHMITDRFEEEWHRLDDDLRNKLIERTDQALKITKLMVQVYETLDSQMRRLQNPE